MALYFAHSSRRSLVVLRQRQHPVLSTNIHRNTFVIFLEGVGGDWPLLTSYNSCKIWDALTDPSG